MSVFIYPAFILYKKERVCINESSTKKHSKGGFPLVRLVTGTGTRIRKWSCEHAQCDNFAFT